MEELDAVNAKLMNENRQLQKERHQLALQTKKQELCLSHLLKKLQEATDLAKEQQSNFDQAVQRQTESMASMFQELSSSRNQIIRLRTDLESEKIKSHKASPLERMLKTPPPPPPRSSRRVDSVVEDISDEETVHIVNTHLYHQKDVIALEDEIAHLRLSLIQQEAQHKATLKNNQKRIDELENKSRPQTTNNRPHKPPLASSSSSRRQRPESPSGKNTRRGLQEVDTDAPRPLFMRASSLRGFAQSLRQRASSYGGYSEQRINHVDADEVSEAGSINSMPSSRVSDSSITRF